jgi:hypothetical protein
MEASSQREREKKWWPFQSFVVSPSPNGMIIKFVAVYYLMIQPM